MEVGQAIRRRRAVRSYTDDPVPDDALDRVLALALRAPTGSGAQSWGLLVIRDPRRRREVAELVIDGATQYFSIMRPTGEGVSDDEHLRWAREYAEGVIGTYRHVPVWVLGLVIPRKTYPPQMAEWGRQDDVISLAFAMENLMLAARAEGLGTVPTTAFWRLEEPRLRAALNLPDDVEPCVLTPLGVPTAFPTGKPPALAKTFKSWRSLVHDDVYGAVREDVST